MSDSPSGDMRIGAAVIGLFFVLFLGWAAIAPLDAGAYASGQVAISGNRQAVQHQQGGVVSALHVAEGDRVHRGQILVELATGELQATERGVTGQVVSLLAQRARLIAERDGLASIAMPTEFAAYVGPDLVLARDAMRLQRLQFMARRNGRSTETGVLTQRIGQLNQQVEGLQRQIESNLAQRQLIERELDGVRSLAARGFAPQTRVMALERSAVALDGELGSLRAQIAGTNETIGQTRLQMLGVSTTMEEDVADQLRQTEVSLNELRPRMVELRAQIARSRVRAPATGEVVGLTTFTVGGVIAPGQTLMDIVPEDASQVIIASINPPDIDNLRLGLSTEVKFPGLRERSTPLLHGTVTRLSPDSFTDEKSGRTFYRAEVVIPPDELRKLGASAQNIRPGMPVEVVVLLRKRTALQYLIEPLTSGLWRSGSEQ
ncbi:HlyD family type I secretion periplasmic adaptor subunit [Brevundimonas subvibrioides]|uniref:HlyD family type I secretion periplasmic adaptor subunit n=1 Tax=Brevundimonas subvibrioides TaxID=74313 RepID=UPI0022B513C2|nr:HlyD family type I secretion periplasmic adaptor subunit [Brevundimonas subvibrioides]